MNTKRAKLFDNTGFSLVELIVVIAIMAILAAVAIPTFAHFITKANQAADIQFMHDLERAIVLANAEKEMGEITQIKVKINTYDGSIQSITYVETVLHEGIEQAQKIVCPIQRNSEQPLVNMIDWSYTFKAIDSVEEHQGWKEQWYIETFEKTPWDE